jgi:hypothetical protein
LITLDEIRRHPGRRTRYSIRKYRLPVALELLLGVEGVGVEHIRRIELAALGAARKDEH